MQYSRKSYSLSNQAKKDDIEGIDLFAQDCEIRYIITKQAFKEGWDCSFAYVLTVLTNPSSATGITQLVGRILRQPFARKNQSAGFGRELCIYIPPKCKIACN